MHKEIFIFLKDLNKILSPKEISTEIQINIDQSQGQLRLTAPDEDQIKTIISNLSQEIKVESGKMTLTVKLYNQDEDFDFSPHLFLEELASFVRFFSYSTSLSIDEEEVARLNGFKPLWRKDPSEVSIEECNGLYQSLSFSSDEAPPWVFIKTYEPLEVEGILFFRKYNPYDNPALSNGLHLLVEQAPVHNKFILDLIPEFIKNTSTIIEIKGMSYEEASTLSHSVKIYQLVDALVFNIAESIRRLNRKHREHYEQMWPIISHFTKKGCLQSKKFDEVMRPHILYRTYNNKLLTMDEYVEKHPLTLEDSPVIPYFDTTCMNTKNLDYALSKNIDPIYIVPPLDHLFLRHDEFGFHKERIPVHFLSVEQVLYSSSSQTETAKLSTSSLVTEYFKKKLRVPKDSLASEYSIVFKNLGELAPSMILLIEEESRRFYYESIMSAPLTDLPIKAQILVNADSPKLKDLDKLPSDQAFHLLEHLYLMATEHLWRDLCPPVLSDT